MSSAAAARATLQFQLDPQLHARQPPEARGLARDAVRLLISEVRSDRIVHAQFRDLPCFLSRGDLLVVNASATINAALEGKRGHEPVEVHLSGLLEDDWWLVELRRVSAQHKTEPLFDAQQGEDIRLAGGASAQLLAPFRPVQPDRVRLWIARLECPDGVLRYTEKFGAPIRYSHVADPWPLQYYQTIFAREPGSAEMPSAGRPFTQELVAHLRQRNIRVAPIVLHTGVSSLDAGESPYPERYRVPAATALAINHTRAAGGRVIAVGTTVVRALETVAAPGGRVHAAAGWSELHITSGHIVRSIDGLLTGLHAPNASHLDMLEAIAGREQLERAYSAALQHEYLWHEFGDMHLLRAQ